MGQRPKNFEEAINELENQGTTFITEELARLEKHVADLKEKLKNEGGKARETVEKKVKENPWAVVGLVGLIFFVIGLFIAGRRSDK